MEDKIKRLRKIARDAIQQYSDEVFGGGEPVFPQWANDLADVLDAVEAIGAGGVSGQRITGERPPIRQFLAALDKANSLDTLEVWSMMRRGTLAQRRNAWAEVRRLRQLVEAQI